MARLLVIHHSPTRAVNAITGSVLAGCHDDAIEGVEVVQRRALEFATGSATADDILGADGYLLGTTANFGYMSGALKHVFDSTFLAIGGSLAPDGSAAPLGGNTTGRPFGLYVHGRYDMTGAVRSVLSIVGALGKSLALQGWDLPYPRKPRRTGSRAHIIGWDEPFADRPGSLT